MMTPEVLMAVEIRHKRFTVDEYYAMAEAGILKPGDRVELIEGEIVEMTPMGSAHSGCLNRLMKVLSQDNEKALLTSHTPLHISTETELEPDMMILHHKESFYSDKHPIPEDVYLLIEVADTSYNFDLNVKLPLYANAGIPEYWIVNLEAEVLEIYRDPQAEEYETCIKIDRTFEESFAPIAFPELELKLSDLIG